MEEKDVQPNETPNQERQPQTTQTSVVPQLDELTQKLADAGKQIEYYKDLLLRKSADFDNFKKRSENEATSLVKYAKADVITDLLPIVDDFERSMKLSKDRRESEAFLKGVELIHQKLLRFLETQGVRPLESLGKEFDVHYHDALLQVPRNDVPPHTVIEEVEKGYMLDDRIIRHAKVVVSTAPLDHGNAEQGSASHPMSTASGTKKASEK
jgi:molecular chaperone GrpE